MLLVLDAGNTHLRVGTARDGLLATVRRAATPREATADDVELLIEGLLGLDGVRLSDATAIAVSATVPGPVATVEAIAERSRLACAVASAGTVPLPVRVERPGDVGPDRLVNAYAAAHLHGTPIVVVDCGTATTLDAVDHAGAFVGGAIAPGMGLGLDALHARTARLPRVEPRLPDGPIGRDTAAAIRVGTVLGHRLMIEGLVERQCRELAAGAGIAPEDVRVVLTGGLAALPWARTVEGVDVVDPDLTMRGLVLFHQAVAGPDEA
jgi:type III pantothenate kinase